MKIVGGEIASAEPFPIVIETYVLEGLTLWLRFASGETGIVDLEGIVRGQFAERLRDRSYFEQVEVDTEIGTIVWPDGFDISPTALLENLSEVIETALPEMPGQTHLEFFGKLRSSQLHYGDNLDVLRERVPNESVDLVYLDPPFNSKKNYNVLFRTPDGDVPKESRQAFTDFWVWNHKSERDFEAVVAAGGRTGVALESLMALLGRSDLMAYLTMMAPRLVELRRTLKETGSIYLHCDQRTNHYLKLLMDAVFGPENFLNNVVWLYGLGGSSSRYWPRKHDDLLWYSRYRGKQYFEADKIPASSSMLKGRLKKAPDWWEIPSLNNMAAERLGYPTQKPLELLDRVIRSSSPQQGVVLDPFCGGGTTLESAERLGRTWVGIDVSYLAVEITERRLEMKFGSDVRSSYKLFGTPKSMADAELLYEQSEFDFRHWAVGLVDADPIVGKAEEIDGVRGFPMPEGQDDGKTVIRIGDQPNDLRVAMDAIESGEASLGVVVPLRPNMGLVRSASELGGWTWPVNGETYPVVQVLSVEELLAGARLVLPTAMQDFPFNDVV